LFVGTATRSSRRFAAVGLHLDETLPTASCARLEHLQVLPPGTRPPRKLRGKRDGSLLAARGLLRALGLRWRLRPGLRKRLRPLLSRHVWLLPVDVLPLRH